MRNAIVPLLAVGVMVVIVVGSMLLANSNILAAQAAPAEPQATATPEPCAHVATADSIKIFYCEDIHLFVNQLGFMAFEP